LLLLLLLVFVGVGVDAARSSRVCLRHDVAAR
jgi:hypothetical protein